MEETPTTIVSHVHIELLSPFIFPYNCTVNSDNVPYFANHWQIFRSFSEEGNHTVLNEAISTFHFRVQCLVQDLHSTDPFVWCFIGMTSINYNTIEVNLVIRVTNCRAKFGIMHLAPLFYGGIITKRRGSTRRWIIMLARRIR